VKSAKTIAVPATSVVERLWIPLVCIGLVLPIGCLVVVLKTCLTPLPYEPVNLTNFEQIKPGMTKQEVVEFLGPPSSSSIGRMPPGANWIETAVWKGRDGEIDVFFSLDGPFFSKKCIVLDKAAYNFRPTLGEQIRGWIGF
jgi:hypothetical protein